MKTKLDDLMTALQAAAAVCTIGAVKLWAPVCGSMLELANGNETHMKCYYAGQAALGVALIILAIAAAVTRQPGRSLTLQGGEGVGRVTKPGLDQPVGAWAINSTPRRIRWFFSSR